MASSISPNANSLHGRKSGVLGDVELPRRGASKHTDTSHFEHTIHASNPLHSPSNTESTSATDVASNTSIHGGASTVFGASFNFVNSIVGAGIIAIPLAIQECGLVLGVFLLLLVAFLVNRSVLMLIDCGIKTNKFDYEELAEHLLGKRGYYVTLVFMFLFAYGAQVAYLVIIGDTIPRAAQLLFPGSFFCSRQNTLLLLSTVVVLPLCLFRELSTLSWTSLLSIVADVVIILIVLVACITVSNYQDQHFQVSDTSEVNDSLFEGIGTMSFAFVCQHNSFMVFRSLAQPTAQAWRKVAHLSISFACFVCVSFGLIGFFTFYPYVKGDLLNNFPVHDMSIATARLFLAVTMIFTYPMECYVTRHCVVAIMHKYAQASREESTHNGSVTLHTSTSSRNANAYGVLTSAWNRVWTMINSSSINPQSTHSPYGHLDNGMRSSPLKSRNQHGGDHGGAYTNVQEDGEDVTIMFVENQVLMLYDVSIDDTPDTSAVRGRQQSSGSRESGKAVVGAGAQEAVSNSLLRSSGGIESAKDSAPGVGDRRDSMESTAQREYAANKADVGDIVQNANIANTEDGGAGGADGAAGEVSLGVHVLLTLLIWGSTLCIALVFKQLGVVSALTGAVAASVLGYILPAVLYLKAHETELHAACAHSAALYHNTASPDPSGVNTTDATGTCTGANNIMSEEDLTMAEAGVVEITFNMDDLDDDAVNTVDASKKRTISCDTVMRYVAIIAAFRQFYLSFGLIVFGLLSLVIGVTTVLMNAV